MVNWNDWNIWAGVIFWAGDWAGLPSAYYNGTIKYRCVTKVLWFQSISYVFATIFWFDQIWLENKQRHSNLLILCNHVKSLQACYSCSLLSFVFEFNKNKQVLKFTKCFDDVSWQHKVNKSQTAEKCMCSWGSRIARSCLQIEILRRCLFRTI